MKFSSTVIVAALFGALSVTEVEAIAIRQSEAQRLMESIDLDVFVECTSDLCRNQGF